MMRYYDSVGNEYYVAALSLPPGEPRYYGIFSRNVERRDPAQQQGTPAFKTAAEAQADLDIYAKRRELVPATIFAIEGGMLKLPKSQMDARHGLVYWVDDTYSRCRVCITVKGMRMVQYIADTIPTDPKPMEVAK